MVIKRRNDRLDELAECYDSLVANDRDPELRRRTGYVLVHLAREDASAAFKQMYGVDTITPSVQPAEDTTVARRWLLDFLRAYLADGLNLDPISDVSLVLRKGDSPFLRAFTGARAAHALLGPHSYGGVFVLQSLAILAGDVLEAGEYRDVFVRIRSQLASLDAAARHEADVFGLPSVDYALAACDFNSATRLHEWAVDLTAEGKDAGTVRDLAWAHVLAISQESRDQIRQRVLLAEHAGVAFGAGDLARVHEAWDLATAGGVVPEHLIEELRTIQSDQRLVDAARDSLRTRLGDAEHA
ncbi:MAG: hypothetical protein AAGI30_11780 [Planctomycetota bacterium]